MKARYFNNIKYNEDTGIVTKSSTDTYKIKREFKYYYLLPEDLKQFFVKPFNYRESENESSYDMKYAGVTVYEFMKKCENVNTSYLAAIRIAEQLINFFKIKSKYSKTEYNNNFSSNKVNNRMLKFKRLPEYKKIDYFLKANDIDLDQLVKTYNCNYLVLSKETIVKNISHGDLHFSNILIDENNDFKIKFIDVRGALNEDELYIDEYYDMAKLMHSIIGYYDSVINDDFEIFINDNLDNYNFVIQKYEFQDRFYSKILELLNKSLIFNENNSKIVNNYIISLFLSMLPLHKNNLKHILAFIKISQILEDKYKI